MADFDRLQNNIIDMLIEQQLKLGYMNESVALYYPLESIQALLDVTLDEVSLKSVLEQFSASTKEIFGGITFSSNKGRFCLRVPPSGGAYVHEMMERQTDNKFEFLREFLNCVVKHGVLIEDLVNVFNKYSNHVAIKRLKEDEFDYLIYFEDCKPDDYRYCIKYEGEHATYHRFTVQDFEKFGFTIM